MYMPSSKWTWAFTLVAIVQAAIILAFESYVFATFQLNLDGKADNSDTHTRTIPTFLALYIFGFIYELVLVWDALRLKNTIQVVGLVAYNAGLLLYGAVQMSQIKDAVLQLSREDALDSDTWAETKGFLIAIPCIIAFMTCLMVICAWKLYDEFAWTIYKHISADLRMKRRYLTFQVYIALLKFDFFFFLGFTVQFVVIVTVRKAEFACTIAAIPVTIIILLLAAYFCRRESLIGTIPIIFLYFGGLAYFLFKLVRMYSASHRDAYLPARKELTTFAVLTILSILMTIVNSIMCAANYNKGLKPYITNRKVETEEEKMATYQTSTAYAPYTTEMQQQGNAGKVPSAKPMPPRMEID